jgi:hypothetical protein
MPVYEQFIPYVANRKTDHANVKFLKTQIKNALTTALKPVVKTLAGKSSAATPNPGAKGTQKATALSGAGNNSLQPNRGNSGSKKGFDWADV